MEHSTPRPSTPPLSPGLLTPPSTGGFGKPSSFAGSQEGLHSSKRQSKSKTQEGETLTEFFEDLKEDSKVQADNDSDVSPLPLDPSSVSSHSECSAGTTRTSAVSHEPEHTVLDKIGFFDSPSPSVTASAAVDPLPFMKLPLSVRNRVYEYLLVIPAIICVRQKHTAFHEEKKAFLYAERRELLPSIAFALTQAKVDGPKSRLSRFKGTNLNILRANKEVFTEARAVMYSMNSFDIVKPTNELTPQPDFSIAIFPSGYQRLATKLHIRIRTFYDLDWLLSGGYNVLKNYYRGLQTLTLILELDAATKEFGRAWARQSNEKWTVYIKRLRSELAEDLLEGSGTKGATPVPVWMNLRVLFSNEAYFGSSDDPVETLGVAVVANMQSERVKRIELRSALMETWELFKKGGKQT